MNFKDVNFYAHIICFRNLNIYEACVPDCMHHIDLELFKYQLEFTQDILKAIGGIELQKNLVEMTTEPYGMSLWQNPKMK